MNLEMRHRSISPHLDDLTRREEAVMRSFFVGNHPQACEIMQVIRNKSNGDQVLVINPSSAQDINHISQTELRAPEAAPDGFLISVSPKNQTFTLEGVIEISVGRGLKLQRKLAKLDRYFQSLRDSNSGRHAALKSAIIACIDYKNEVLEKLKVADIPLVAFISQRPYSEHHAKFITKEWCNRFCIYTSTTADYI